MSAVNILGIVGSARPRRIGELCGFGKPGSVLIFPYADADPGKTLITVTNTNKSYRYCGGGEPDIFEGTVRVKFLFVFGDFCQVANEVITLTPNDTYSVFLDEINLGANGEKGRALVR